MVVLSIIKLTGSSLLLKDKYDSEVIKNNILMI